MATPSRCFGEKVMNRHKLFLVTSPILLLAACSGAEEANESTAARSSSLDIKQEEQAMAADAAAEMGSGPDVRVSAAPGVAFNYRYAFRVPDAKISAVQEGHAAACETLGLSRCRITGMRYRLVDEDEVEASLAFKLDPEIARKFGKDAISSVEKAEGILVDSSIEGVDVGSGITASQRRSSDLTAEINRIEARLKAGGLGDRERTELQEQAARIREQLDGERDTRRVGEESLATTPMEFSYRGGDGIPGFDSGNPFADAFKSAVSSAAIMVSFILMLAGVMLPWLALLTLLVILWRSAALRGVRSWWRKSSPLVDEPVKD
jgi:hypothetical protein